MRVMPIQVTSGFAGMKQLKAAFRSNWKFYLQEALGLGIFMISACFFGSLLFADKSTWLKIVPDPTLRNILMGVAMGVTALFIFYSPLTAASGSQINPAVTLTFLRLGRMCRYDALFFLVFQLAGGIIAVMLMQLLLGDILTQSPVNSVVTIPGKFGIIPAIIVELLIAFATMTMVLFTSHHQYLKRYTRICSASLVCIWVVLAGPVSGFGMNPARSFASALPSGTWTAFWIYILLPFIGMLLAAEFFLLIQRKKNRKILVAAVKTPKRVLEPFEFVL